jgi:hypothetical protein
MTKRKATLSVLSAGVDGTQGLSEFQEASTWAQLNKRREAGKVENKKRPLSK